ncbi:hypothetical protein [Lysobacter humi (ex Lee et al. 2017)]
MTHRPSFTRTRRSLRLAALVASCVAIGGAQAAWEVNDRNSQRILDQINDRIGNGNANEKLGQIYDSHQIGSSQTAGSLEPEPTGDERLNQAVISPVTINADQRCPSMSASPMAVKQRLICEELMKTEKAKYMYSLRMYKLTETRKRRLEDLERERSNLQSHDYGKLESNSNQLLALMSLMQLDRQQHAAYMAAYDARIQYLTVAQDTLSEEALNGSKQTTGGGVAGAITGGAVLAGALEALKTQRNGNWRTGEQ